jgi:UDP-N-acetylmuramoyl-tripeptide--D-alanyl-D-alanine ligase
MAELGWRLTLVARLTGGRMVGAGDPILSKVAIDSRGSLRGALFAALKGGRFDGHDFAAEAVARGASAVLVEREIAGLPVPQVVVMNALGALQELGRARRAEFGGPVAAVTGSAGKTTTRRILTAIMQERYRTLEPVKNFNNHIGVPLTLLELGPQHEAAVIELGCSDFGEIALLTRLADPDAALVTNVGPAHLEKLGDLAGVARAKGELFAGLKVSAVAVVNMDDPRVLTMPISARRRVGFGAAGDADVRLLGRRALGLKGQSIRIAIGSDEVEAELPLAGEHNARNALAAAAAAFALGLRAQEIVLGISRAVPAPGRLGLRAGPRGSLIIDDTYNANPSSMRAAVAALLELKGRGRAVCVLADMLELGEGSLEAHEELGAIVAQAKVDRLVTMGEGGAAIDRGAARAGLAAGRRRSAKDHAEAAAMAREKLKAGDAILVKGSHGMRMENVVEELLKGMD